MNTKILRKTGKLTAFAVLVLAAALIVMGLTATPVFAANTAEFVKKDAEMGGAWRDTVGDEGYYMPRVKEWRATDDFSEPDQKGSEVFCKLPAGATLSIERLASLYINGESGEGIFPDPNGIMMEFPYDKTKNPDGDVTGCPQIISYERGYYVTLNLSFSDADTHYIGFYFMDNPVSDSPRGEGVVKIFDKDADVATASPLADCGDDYVTDDEMHDKGGWLFFNVSGSVKIQVLNGGAYIFSGLVIGDGSYNESLKGNTGGGGGCLSAMGSVTALITVLGAALLIKRK